MIQEKLSYGHHPPEILKINTENTEKKTENTEKMENTEKSNFPYFCNFPYFLQRC